MMPLLFPSVGGRVGGGKRVARSTLAFTIKNKIERIIRVDAATIARAIGRDFGDGVATAVAAALLFRFAENKDGRTFEHLPATSGHRMSGGGATLMSNTTADSVRRPSGRLDDDDFRQNGAGELSRQRIHIFLEGVPAIRAQTESDGLRRRSRCRVQVFRMRGDGARTRRFRARFRRTVAYTGRG